MGPDWEIEMREKKKKKKKTPDLPEKGAKRS